MRNRTSQELRELRQRSGLTIAQLCRITGVSRKTWEQWETSPDLRGYRAPSELAFAWLELYIKHEVKEL